MKVLQIKEIHVWGGEEIKLASLSLGYGVVIGFFLGMLLIQSAEDFKGFTEGLFGEIISLKEEGFNSMFLAIYQRNLVAALITVGLGLIHRFAPMGIIALNGLIFGAVIYGVVLFNLGVLNLLASIIPHGIFEIPALILSCATGISLTTRGKGLARFKILGESFWPVVMIVILLFIAALIEATLITLL